MWRFSAQRVLSSLAAKKRHRRRGNVTFQSQSCSNQKEPFRQCIKPSTEVVCCSQDSMKSKKNGGPKERKYQNEDAEHFQLPKTSLLEKLAWGGTIFALVLNLRYKFCDGHYEPARVVSADESCPNERCLGITNLLYRLAFTSPGKKLLQSNVLPEEPNTSQAQSFETPKESKSEELSDEEIMQNMEKAIMDYDGLLENFVGVQLSDENPKRAIHHFEEAAEMGCSKALFNLGVCYETGRGTPVDLAKAAENYRLATKAGHSIAAYNLGVFYLEGIGGLKKNYDKGFKLINKAANDGVTKAQTALGILYGEQEEWHKAFEMFNAASAQGDVEATYQLGLCYENGWGMSSNMLMAAELYTQAAHKDHDRALHSLGVFYEKGLGGLERNSELAAEMYQMAIDNGNDQARESLKALQEAEAAKYNYISANAKKQYSSSNYTSLSNVLSPGLHSSSSSPELRKNNPYTEHHKIGISQYLGLILPSILTGKTGNELINSSDFDRRQKINDSSTCTEDSCLKAIHSVQHVLAVT